jgi:hypothetical protein
MNHFLFLNLLELSGKSHFVKFFDIHCPHEELTSSLRFLCNFLWTYSQLE